MTKTTAVEKITLKSISLISGSADPTAGGGVPAAIGSKYFRSGTAGDYTKTGSGDTAYTITPRGADDRAAIQLAIDAASAGGGCIFFPEGSYAVGRTSAQAYSFNLSGVSNVRFLGSGFGAATLVMTGDAATTAWDLFIVRGASSGIEWEDMSFSQDGVTNPPSAGLCNIMRWGDGSTAAQFLKAIRCSMTAIRWTPGGSPSARFATWVSTAST